MLGQSCRRYPAVIGKAVASASLRWLCLLQSVMPLSLALQRIQVYCPHSVHQLLNILEHLALYKEVNFVCS